MQSIKKFIRQICVSACWFYVMGFSVSAQMIIPNPSVCDDMECLLGRFGDIVRTLAGLSFFIMFVYGGFLYMTGRDDDDQLKKARSIMIGAFVGIVLILAAPALSGFVLSLFRNTFLG